MFGSGGGSGQNDISNIPEGDGPAFDITQVGDVVALVRSIVLDKSYDILKDDSSQFEDEDFATLCAGNSLRTTREKSIGDNAILVSNVNLNIPQPNLLNGTVSSTVTYSGHAYTEADSGKSITLDGSATYSSRGEINLSSGTIKQGFCGDEGAEVAGTNTSADTSSGSYQISDGFGGALIYSISRGLTLNTATGDEATNYSFSGSASLKSHDQISRCTINRENNMAHYVIECM